jgi:hypothetical protein
MAKPYTNTSAANAAAAITIPALNPPSDNPNVLGSYIELETVSFGYSAAPTGGVLTIESPPGTVLHEWPIVAGGPGLMTFSGSCLKGAAGQAVKVNLTAGGADITGSVNCTVRDT